MLKRVLPSCTIIILLLFTSIVFGATTGKIVGTVKDSQTGESLPGANVILQGTAIGAATNIEGIYEISKVPPGNYTLNITYIGYKAKSVPVQVGPGETITQDISLVYDVLQGETVTITAQAEGQIAAINQQLSSRTIVNVVSKARIEELPDANAAESIGRLPGVSIIREGGEGNKVAIRGLEPKFSNLTINGVGMPGTDSETATSTSALLDGSADRSADLSMFSANMLDGIELSKALTPDQDADAIGGTINLLLRTAPDGFNTNLIFQKGYNNHENTFTPQKMWGSISKRFYGNLLGVIISGNYEDAVRSSDRLKVNYKAEGDPEEGELYSKLLRTTSLTLQDINTNRERIGGSVMLDYNYLNGVVKLNGMYSRLNHDEDKYDDKYGFETREKEYYFRKTKYYMDLFSGSLSGHHNTSIAFIDYVVAVSNSRRQTPEDWRVQFEEKTAYEVGPVFDHRYDHPDSSLQYFYNNPDMTSLYKLAMYDDVTEETDITAALNIEMPYRINRNITGSLKFGLKYRGKQRERDYDHWRIAAYYGQGQSKVRDILPDINWDENLTPTGLYLMTPFLNPNYDAGNFLDGQYEFGYAAEPGILDYLLHAYGPSVWQTDLGDDRFDHNVDENITSAYIMTTLNLGPKLMIMPGVRYEAERTSLSTKQFGLADEDYTIEELSFLSIDDTTAKRSTDMIFPMIHARYKFTDWLDLRLAATQSTLRPKFERIIPTENKNYVSQEMDRGNPDLKPARAVNYDVSLSAYQSRFGLLTLSGFYKEVDDLYYSFERYLVAKDQVEAVGLDSEFLNWKLEDNINNPHTAYVRGLEIDLQTHLAFLPGIFSGLVLNMNYAAIRSNTRYNYSILETEKLTVPPWVRTTRIDTSRSGRMIRQSGGIANIALGYDYKGFSTRISILYQGNTLTGLGRRPEEDGFTEDLVRWDLAVKQSLGYGLQLFLNVNNLTNQPDRSYEPVFARPTSFRYFGWSSDFGIRYVFN